MDKKDKITNEEQNVKNEQNIEELLKSATETVNEEIKTDNDNKKNKKTKKVIISTSVGLGLFMSALIVGPLLLKNQEDFEDKTETPSWVSKENEKKSEEKSKKEWDFDYPIEVHEWSKQPYDRATFWTEKNTDEIMKQGENIKGLNESLLSIPSSKEHGYDDPNGQLVGAYTNDPTKEYNEDGSENKMFSYAVKEDYVKSFVVNVERILNPVFGEWVFSQRAGRDLKSEQTYEELEDMFTPEWWSANIKEGQDYSKLPLVVDWNGDDWGGLKFAERVDGRYGTFYGEIVATEENPVTGSIKGYDERGARIVELKIPVQYKAFGEDDYLIKKGTLTVEMRSNILDIDSRSRVILSNASLNMGN